jgi:N4-gp56 family major capsid protein
MMMGYTNFIPEVWSKELGVIFDKKTVMANLVNTKYQGEIKKYGDVVHVRTFGNVTVSDYTRNMSISYEVLTDPTQSMTIDQQKYFAFKVDDLDLAQSDTDIMKGYTERAAVAIRNVVDSRLLNHLSDVHADNIIGGTTPVALTKTNIYDNIVRLAELLDVKNIPNEERFLVITPKAKSLLLQSDQFTRASSLGDSVVQNGFIGNVAGFGVYVTTNMPTLSGNVVPLLAFSRDFISFASQVSQVESVRPTDQFCHAVRGLYLYASKAFSPEAGALLRSTIA